MYKKTGDKHHGFKHGLCKTILYKKWSSMKRRCFNKADKGYKNYGGRGISVAEKWLNFTGFAVDMADSYAAGLTLERIDNSKGYSKENCRWATKLEQARNRRNVRMYDFRGEKLCLAEIARKYKVPFRVLRDRLQASWSLETAVFKPLKSKGLGVSFDRARNKWKAYLGYKSKRVELGRFNTKEEALEARSKLENKLI
jgi:hypothetical protein